MARARLVKPSLFTNEDLGELPLAARYLFIGLWCLADREGRLEDRPKKIAVEIFPFDRKVNTEPLLAGLAERGFIVRYVADDRPLIWLPRFKKHQKPHSRETQSVLPPYQGTPKASLGTPKADQGVRYPVSGNGSDPVTRSPGVVQAPEGATPADDPLPFEPSPESDLEPEPSRSRTRPIDAVCAYLPELVAKHPRLDVHREFERFQNYIPATGKRYKDHVAAFRNWLLKEEDYLGERTAKTGRVSASGPRSHTGPDIDAIERYIAYADRPN